jgi:hypothetical protein
MLSVTALVPKVIRPRCRECGVIESPFVLAVAQKLTVVRGTKKVRVEIQFICPQCSEWRGTSCTITRAALHSVFDAAIDAGSCNFSFTRPVRVRTRPSVFDTDRRTLSLGPITDEEVEKVRKKLARTSFKRTSKSWADFLDRLLRGGE